MLASLLVVCLGGWPLAGPTSSAAFADQPASGTVALTGPEVTKLDWNTRDLTPCQLDGDGLVDLALINNDRAKIELLLQRDPDDDDSRSRPARTSGLWEPILDDARFVKQSLVTGIMMYALAVGDLNDDGLTDLAYTGNPDDLTIRYQSDAGDWERLQTVDLSDPVQWSSSLQIRDVDRDGRDDLILLTEAEVVVMLQTAGGELDEARRYPLADEGCFGLVVEDINGDDMPDLLYLLPDDRAPLRYRLQETEGTFGPEGTLNITAPRSQLRPIEIPSIDELCLAGIQDQTGLIEVLRLLPGPKASADRLELNPRLFTTGHRGRAPACYALGDFDGDGRTDLAVGDGNEAQVWLYLQQEGGRLAQPTNYPSLSNLRGLAAGDLDRDGRDELLVVSPREKSVGISRYLTRGRLSFPEAWPVDGTPLAVTIADLDADAVPEIIAVRQLAGERQVVIRSRDPQSDDWREAIWALTDLRTNPMAVEVMDANQDGLSDIAIYTVQSPLRLLVQDRDGRFREASLESGFRNGLVDNLDPAATTLFDLDGDDRPELLVAGKGFVRALRMTADGVLQTADQFNARGGGIEIGGTACVDLDGDGTAEMLLKEKGSDQLQILIRDQQGVYRFEKSLPVGRIDLVDTRVLDLDGNGKPDVLFLGEDRFWWIPIGHRDLGWESLAVYETDLPEHTYMELAVGDIDGDGRDDLITLDSTSTRILEILCRPEKESIDKWRSVLHFKVFEQNPHYRGWQGGLNEPREIVVCDVTDDQKDDILLLVHDRILLYPNR